MAQLVKNPSAMQETWAQSLDWEGLLEKEMVTPSSIHDWEIPWTEEPGGPQSREVARVRHDLATKLPPWNKSASMWMKIGLLRLQSTMKIQEAGTLIIFKKW